MSGFSLSSFIWSRTAEVKWWVLWVSTKLLYPSFCIWNTTKLSCVWFLSLHMKKKCACNNKPPETNSYNNRCQKRQQTVQMQQSLTTTLLVSCFLLSWIFQSPKHTYIHKYKYIIFYIYIFKILIDSVNGLCSSNLFLHFFFTF